MTRTNSVIGVTTTAMNDYTANGGGTIADLMNIGNGNDNEDLSNVFTDFQQIVKKHIDKEAGN